MSIKISARKTLQIAGRAGARCATICAVAG
ncbi:MAG: methanobactin [Tistrella sp.]|jgi:Mb-OB3b family methanobactin precursor|uniref:Methanobactin n=1 Tax=Tistrella mobilis TaxID=171437 RepID=A0A3B9IKG6_9PROT|nr:MULTISPECIES: methanobactin [Tistrella]MAD36816.1 methanobactin [Tistrella sp.]MAM76192.1 methanobactin [Tistrella sp.]MBA79305.1 methanobactin [Tistrella sp.]HAE47813.1 methanobactin [Tistrella mobilis]